MLDAGKKQIQVSFSNSYIRYLGAYIRFFDADGNAISVPNWKPDDAGIIDDIINALDIQYDDLRFLGYISPKNNVMAIPIPPDGQLDVKVTFPANAVSATVYGSGLGTGSDSWPKTPVGGGVMTGLCNLGIPAFMLGFGAAAQSYKPLYDLIQKIPIGAIIVAGLAFFGPQFGVSAAEKKMNWSAFTSLAKILFDGAATKILLWVEAELAADEVADEIPFAGWLILAINIATGIAQIAETIVEVATSPWNIENNVALSITTDVTVHPDPRNKAFPQGDNAHYTVKMIYKDQTRATVVDNYNVPDGSTATTLSATFPNNTLGGQVKFEADYYIGDWLAGKATTGWIENDETHVAQVDLYLVEFPVPLTSQTVYSHTQLLTYRNGNYGWQATPNAPPYVAPNAAPTGNAISAWTGLTLSQRSGMLGFAWKAAGMGITSCASGAGGQLYAMENVNIPGTPMTSLKFPSCGLDGQTMLIYDPYPPKFLMGNDGQWVLDANGRPVPDPNDTLLGNYFVDPNKAAVDLTQGGGYHLRKVTLDDSTPFNMGSNQLSYARFQFQPDSVTLHPSGHVVAVNTQFCKIQIAQLGTDGDQDQNVPLGRVYAGEALNTDRPGLVFHPIAVTCSYDGTLMVLEDTKWSGGDAETVVARIQAFDLFGNPVNRFFDNNNQPTSFLYLNDPTNNNYLDMAAVGDQKMTYIYVLYNTPDPNKAGNFLFSVDVYQYGQTKPDQNPLLTAKNLVAAKMTADMWHTIYTLNYDMVTDGEGQHAGPVTGGAGPAGRTVSSVSEWTPSTPKA